MSPRHPKPAELQPSTSVPVARLRGWWRARAARERVLLATMCAALGLFFGWYGVVSPLQAWREAAAARRAEAAHQLALVGADLAVIDGLARARPSGDAFGAMLASTAGAADVAISHQRGDAGRRVVGIDAVAAANLLAWLDTLHEQHAVGPERVRIERADGRLRVELVFADTP